ncbi:MAG TPA: hypothetical protein PLJ60_04540 [Chryseolinea sp.]|nr:hypothetical protein [Chryseolinea sp.]HPM29584.1 hypothetical protein [Chryseolinea sp.]
MKKSLILSIALVICGSMAYAQNSKSFYKSSYESRNSGSWDQASSIISFGLGFPNVAPNAYGGNSGFPPLYVKYEHGFLRDEVGLGGYVSTGFGETGNYYGVGNPVGYQTNFFAFSIAVLGYYHFNKLIPIEKMDVYAGAGLAFKNVSYDDQDYYDNDATITVPVKVGIRYYIKPAFAFYAESGWDGMSAINLGVTLKLN